MTDSKTHFDPPKVLLTTVCRPFGKDGEGDSVGAELFHAQVTRSQGIFSYRQVIRCWGLDYIAENIDAPAVVLHYPSEGELVREIRANRFDYIGINFVVATYHKLRRAAHLIRRHAPQAKIVVGGYGTVLSDAELTPYADFICREEGDGYMRRLLGEPKIDKIRHPYAPIESPQVFSVPLPHKGGPRHRRPRLPQWLRFLLHVPLFQAPVRAVRAKRQRALRNDPFWTSASSRSFSGWNMAVNRDSRHTRWNREDAKDAKNCIFKRFSPFSTT